MNQEEYLKMRACEDRLWWYRALHRYLGRFVETVPSAEQRYALDIGCGTGAFAQNLRRKGYRVVGIDMSSLAIRQMYSRNLPLSCVADANSLPFADLSFDLVSCIDVLECESVDPETTIKEAMRVLKPGGYGLFQMAAHQWLLSEHDRAVHSVRRYSLRELKSLLRLPGIRIVHGSYLFLQLFPFMALWKILRRPAVGVSRDTASSDVALPPAFINFLLQLPCALEAFFLPYISLPLGTSACILIKKNAT